MVNKKGILRIVEASIAILIIIAVVISLSLSKRAAVEKDLSETISPLLEEIAKNNSMRDEIINNPVRAEVQIQNFLAERIKEPNIGYNVTICDIGGLCNLSYPGMVSGSVYAGSRVISSSLEGAGAATPKRVSLFLWIKG